MTNRTPAPSTRNVTRIFRTATAEQILAGAAWYSDAHEIASALAAKNGVSVSQAAGVLAAVSPLNSWGSNVNLAARILAAGGLTAGYLSVGLGKASAILASDGGRETVLAILNGEKIQNFYLGILTKGAKGVCIDRHSYSLVTNHRYNDDTMPTIKGKRYRAAVEAHVRAARILSKEYGETFTPAQVQSVCWTLWRSRYWAVGAFDGHEEI